MNYVGAFLPATIAFILGLVLIIVSNWDYSDGQCRSKLVARIYGILYMIATVLLIISGIMVIRNPGLIKS